MASPAEQVVEMTGVELELAQAVLDHVANDVSGTLYPLSSYPCPLAPPSIFPMEADCCAPALLFFFFAFDFLFHHSLCSCKEP
jgi:hypothetical protein